MNGVFSSLPIHVFYLSPSYIPLSLSPARVSACIRAPFAAGRCSDSSLCSHSLIAPAVARTHVTAAALSLIFPPSHPTARQFFPPFSRSSFPFLCFAICFHIDCLASALGHAATRPSCYANTRRSYSQRSSVSIKVYVRFGWICARASARARTLRLCMPS